ncbi:MAG: hypothetical protein Sylvanvirus1_93 [Sylvanvirus sp.]|uniref:Fe2OG dioxygenase domain-containing protein n=1 Tax=Sylvanvirus sp. TaxID=2487774 RepID=A0A3G5AH29_9VIRU|nr:MAG: hypothetical protein Sylvanvirus1_93 [Sylvanvirus sp.]
MSSPSTISVDIQSIVEDSWILHPLMPQDESSTFFHRLKQEIKWESMSHRGSNVPRLVHEQGCILEDGSTPLYRHPVDSHVTLYPFSDIVKKIKSYAEQQIMSQTNKDSTKSLGPLGFNHVLIQLYRNGSDHIGEHADKTLDMVPHTCIATASLYDKDSILAGSLKDSNVSNASNGIRRMKFCPKPYLNEIHENASQDKVDIPLLDNSLLHLGWKTNQTHTHAIPREYGLRSDRISLTFRCIHTYLSVDRLVFGVGGRSKTLEEARVNANARQEREHKDKENDKENDLDIKEQYNRLYKGFAKQNKVVEFDVNQFYGPGFDIIDNHDQGKGFIQ